MCVHLCRKLPFFVRRFLEETLFPDVLLDKLLKFPLRHLSPKFCFLNDVVFGGEESRYKEAWRHEIHLVLLAPDLEIRLFLQLPFLVFNSEAGCRGLCPPSTAHQSADILPYVGQLLDTRAV